MHNIIQVDYNHSASLEAQEFLLVVRQTTVQIHHHILENLRRQISVEDHARSNGEKSIEMSGFKKSCFLTRVQQKTQKICEYNCTFGRTSMNLFTAMSFEVLNGWSRPSLGRRVAVKKHSLC